MTFDRLITDPRYIHAKKIVDGLIRDQDYRYSDEPYFDPRVTWLEVLRIAFASYMAKTSKKLRTTDQIRKQINSRTLQEWLEWTYKIQRGIIEDYSGSGTESHNYRKSPGVNRWKSIYARSNEGYVWACGEHKIHFNRYECQFSDEPFEIDETIIEKVKDEVEEYIGLSRKTLKIGVVQNKENLEIYLSKGENENEIITRVMVHAFSIEKDRFSAIDHVLENIDCLKHLPKLVREDFIRGGWPEERPATPIFSLSCHKIGNAQGEEEIRMNIGDFVKYEGIGHKLKAEPMKESVGYMIVIERNAENVLKEYHCASAIQNKTLISYTPATMMNDVLKGGKLAASRLKRRENIIRKNGKDFLEIDAVTTFLMGLTEKYYPEKIPEIHSKKKTSVKMDIAQFEGFIKGKPKAKKEVINFGTTEGKITSRVYIKEGVLWERGRLLVPAIPKTMMVAIIGKQAREIIDHPIADMLGPVMRAAPVSHNENMGTWITFEPKKDLMQIKP